jgi:hypothetical protein
MVAGIRAETRSKYVIDRLLMTGRPLWVQVCWLLLLSISFGLLVGGRSMAADVTQADQFAAVAA